MRTKVSLLAGVSIDSICRLLGAKCPEHLTIIWFLHNSPTARLYGSTLTGKSKLSISVTI